MILSNTLRLKQLTDGGIKVQLFETGDIFNIIYEDFQINLLNGNLVDGSAMNLYLRVHEDQTIKFTPLMGKHSPSTFLLEDQKAIYRGTFEGVYYEVVMSVSKFKFDLSVYLSSYDKKVVDVIYGQDVAITSKWSVLNSEPYTVQYIDYKSYQDENGYTLCARQNQGRTQFLQVGSYTKNVAYSTDGFQFFGLSYKDTSIPEVLLKESLESKIYQYEFSYFALQSEKMTLNSGVNGIHFYAYYDPNFEGVIEKPYPVTLDEKHHELIINVDKNVSDHALLNSTRVLSGLEIRKNDLFKEYPVMDQVEEDEHGLLSFFTPTHDHIVTKQKELLVERQHGHLMVHGDVMHVSENVMATTNWMFGVFNSHVVLGNTSFNKLLGDLRNPLNVQKISGQRIYLKYKNQYHLLGLPSYYVMNALSTKWVYVLEDDVITIDSLVDAIHLQQTLKLTSKSNKAYDLIISSQIVMGANEHMYDITYTKELSSILFEIPKDSMMANAYPSLKYKVTSEEPFEIISEQVAFHITPQHGLLLMKYDQVLGLTLNLQATFKDSFEPINTLDPDESSKKSIEFIESFSNHLELSHKDHQDELNILMHTTYWYTHNAMVHYSSPHGLEQYNGAAWGTRDVCQGPIEYFMATGHYDLVREILLKVYSRQFIENGDFPQWYMFDKYYQIQAHESHGDVIVWPLRALAYYLRATGDIQILNERIGYMSFEKNQFTENVSLLSHVEKQIQAIIKSFIPNTYLPRYGGGDWDDTLQPANHELTQKMVSGWTVALLYEAIRVFSDEIIDVYPSYAKDLKTLNLNIVKNYEEHIIVDEIPSGFVVFDNDQKTYLLHPRDQKTGLKYRLLPFTRSMIAELATPAKVKNYVEIIDKYLKHPDGVRLMNTAVAYQGGKNTYFQRAETAANFGREIGLQYVHAHIRYVEAMAKIGHADDAYQGLFTINPIQLRKRIKTAYYRQANMYFSSSDAWFMDRYQAKDQFELIRTGEIKVKGGWRLYSSGPGIYTNQLITNILGISSYHGDLVIHPALPKSMDGLNVIYHFNGKKINLTYRVGKQDIKLNGYSILYHQIPQRYKNPASLIERKMLMDQSEEINLEVFYQ